MPINTDQFGCWLNMLKMANLLPNGGSSHGHRTSGLPATPRLHRMAFPLTEEIECSLPLLWERNGSRHSLPVTYVVEEELLAWGHGGTAKSYYPPPSPIELESIQV